ncbi:MAG: ABC transporter permease, partial [Bacillota bacterium]
MMKIVKNNLEYLISLGTAILVSLFIGGLIMWGYGSNPLAGYLAMLQGAFGSQYHFATTIAKMVPLVLTGLATAVAFRSGIYNIGGEGQLYLGAFAAAFIGITFTGLPGYLGILLAVVFAAAVGAFYAFIPAMLKVTYNIDEVITTILMNSIAILFTGYLINYPFRAAQGRMGGTDMIEPAFRLSRLVRLSDLNTSIFMTGLIAVAIYYLMAKTTVGYDFKMVGQNANFARYGGVKTKKRMVTAMLISGGLCGIAGAFEVLGVHYRFLQAISPGFFFDGLLIALIVKNNPIGIVLMAFFFAVLKTGSLSMEMATQIPSEIVLIIQSIIIFFIAGEQGFKRLVQSI